MNKQKSIKTIVVTGDVTIDWNIARMRRTEGAAQAWTAEEVTAAFCQRGGAAMLADLVGAVAENLKQAKKANFEVRQVNLPQSTISPTDSRFHHSYAMWASFRLDERKPESGNVWRVQEFLGLNPLHASSRNRLEKVADDPASPDIVILDDANLGFRDRPQLWPQAISKSKTEPWVLVKIAKPVVQGKLWEYLYKNHAERLIVVMTAGDLRSSQVQISRQLSWERTAQDLVWELLHNPQVNTLAQCAHVIVSFGTAGAVLLSRDAKSITEAVLFFDPGAMESEWGGNHKGYMVGYNSCLTAGIARELMLNVSKPDISRGIQSGVHAMRTLHIEGYGKVSNDLEPIKLVFPTSRIAEVLADDSKCLATARIRNPVQASPTHYWTILEDKNPASLEAVAEKIVLEGLEHALKDVPIGQFGSLKTVDRKEIESLHSISTLIRDYCQRRREAPLSIAVFGPPGSGKSFSIEEVAKSVMPDEIKKLTFNLSQLAGPENLYDAFHQVRDVALSGKIPLVFWDEFDAQLQHEPLGWLRYFLAPMQDGIFQEGQLTHPIGRCIFVFAGGTSYSMEAFSANLDAQRAVKLPDFVSRLKGFLNILGPNRQTGAGPPGQYADPYHIIRRAIILRSDFERFTSQLLRREGSRKIVSIDQGVLRAFLLVNEYRHGARSIEAIMAMSQLAGKTCFERSCLPSETQLSLHVDGLDFSAIVHKIELNDEIVEKLAKAFHEVFCDSLRAKHYKYGRVTDDKKREHSSLRPYAELPENEKEQNRSNVRDIANKLALVGYIVIPARGNLPPGEFTVEEVEILSKEEHERWHKQKLAAGWKYAKRTDKALMKHKDLIRWEKLSEVAREKDRLLVRAIPKILAKAGYMTVKLYNNGSRSSS
jgi:hypothetical protein